MNRRRFLAVVGAGGAFALAGRRAGAAPFDGFVPISPSRQDALLVPPGFRWEPVRVCGDPVQGTERFGFNADFTAFFPLGGDEGLLWVNHEFVNLKTSDAVGVWEQTFAAVMGGTPTVDDMKQDVGGSVLHLRREGGRWAFVEASRYNRRITASPSRRRQRLTSDGPAVTDVFERHDVDGLGRTIEGTHSNCSGGQTPWGTVLSCEENVQNQVPDDVDASGRGTVGGRFGTLGSKYGWVVEVIPTTGSDAGRARQFASAPCEAELTGPSLAPDERTLFLSVQHPGERSGIRGAGGVVAPRGSNWPAGTPGAPPRPGVVAISRE